MWGLETIREINRENGERAREQGIQPARYTGEPIRIPTLGDEADSWDESHTRLKTLFVDISGFGAPDEPALTHGQMWEALDALVDEHGPLLVALKEHGQFQGYLAVWAEGSLDTSEG